jgi:hypothetical protein
VLKTHSQRIKIVRPPARNVRKDELPLLEALNARRVLLENVSLMMEPASCVLLVIIQTRPTQCQVIDVIEEKRPKKEWRTGAFVFVYKFSIQSFRAF